MHKTKLKANICWSEFSSYLCLSVLDQLWQAKRRGNRPTAYKGRPFQSPPERHRPCSEGAGQDRDRERVETPGLAGFWHARHASLWGSMQIKGRWEGPKAASQDERDKFIHHVTFKVSEKTTGKIINKENTVS